MVMEAIDTAAPEAVATAETQVETPPSDLTVATPETVVPDSPETEQPEAPETESPSPLSALDDVDEDVLLDHPRIKDVLARREESARRRAEQAAANARAESDAQWVQKGEFREDLSKILRDSLSTDNDTGETRLSLDPKAIDGFTERLNKTNVRGLVGAISTIVDSRLGKDFSLSTEEASRLRDVHAAFQGDPGKHGGAYLETLLDLAQRAAVEAAKPDLKKEIEKALRKEFETKAEAEKRQAAEATARSGGSPTNVGGLAPGNYDLKTIKGLSRAHAAGALSDDEYAQRLRDL